MNWEIRQKVLNWKAQVIQQKISYVWNNYVIHVTYGPIESNELKFYRLKMSKIKVGMQ